MRNTANSGIVDKVLLIIGLIIALVLVGYLGDRYDKTYINTENDANVYGPILTSGSTSEDVIETPDCGIVVTSPKENAVTYSPLVINGYVNGCGWEKMDGKIGTVVLYDSSTGQALSSKVQLSVLTTTSLGNTNFTATLSYPDTTSSLTGFLYFEHSDGVNTFSLPIKY